MKELNFKAVQVCNETLQNIQPEVLTGSPELCYQTAIWCAAQRAFTGEMMAIAKKDWMDQKAKTYQNFILSNEANNSRVDKYGVMVVKDYINSKCGAFEARYEYCERTNSALGSMEDVLRSVISALKEEMYSMRSTK